jgi:hypothetical protein
VWLEKAFAEGSNAIAYMRPDYQHTQLARDPRYQGFYLRALTQQ